MKAPVRGFTLIEILLALAIFSIVVGGLFTIGDYVYKRSVVARKETRRLLELTNFISDFSDLIKKGNGVLYISTREIGIWKEDRDGDGRPYTDETVGFVWDGRSPGTVYRRVGYDESVSLANVDFFELAFDEPAPRTRHVLYRLSVEGQVYQTSLRVRR